jgi:hypothetical protein
MPMIAGNWFIWLQLIAGDLLLAKQQNGTSLVGGINFKTIF